MIDARIKFLGDSWQDAHLVKRVLEDGTLVDIEVHRSYSSETGVCTITEWLHDPDEKCGVLTSPWQFGVL